MAYKYSGYARCKCLQLLRGNAGRPFYITNEFTFDNNVYPQLTDEEFARMSDIDYSNRLIAFVNFIYSNHSGLENECPDLTLGSVVKDVTLCPINITIK